MSDKYVFILLRNRRTTHYFEKEKSENEQIKDKKQKNLKISKQRRGSAKEAKEAVK